MPTLSERERGFRQGAALACAIIAREFGEPARAAEVLAEMGLTLAKLREADVAACDLAPLRHELARLAGA